MNKYHPDLFYSYYNLGGNFFSKKDFKKSILFYEKAIEISTKVYGENNDENLDVFFALGLANYQLKRFDIAINYFNKAKTINQEIGGIYYYLAISHKEKSDLKKAKDNYLKCIEIRKTSLGEDHELTLKTIKVLGEMQVN